MASRKDAVVAEIEKKITKAFEVFDRESNKTVDVREIGCIIRSLGCFPNEAEVQELLDQVNIEVEDPSGFVHLDKFLPVMTKVLLDERFQPIPEDVLLHAFESLKGYLLRQNVILCCFSGEPFTQEEMEDMLNVAVDPETNILHYRDYLPKLVID
uniref:EF-hand domain-containing protein n=1 Tax=Malurus cyaneus samueli TaxID=2593467 RepID=A0A8C5T2H9_9PASS